MRHHIALLAAAALTAIPVLSACSNIAQGSNPALPSAGTSLTIARGGVRADAGAGYGACYGAFDSTGKFLYVVNNGANSISGYTVQSTGALKPL